MLGLAEHLRDALWRVDSSQARPVDATGGVIVAGMGGSASGGRLAQGAIGPRLTRPLVVSDGYALPGWAGPSTLVLLSSYSGNTEETLAAYDDAAARQAPRIVASTGGALVERARRDDVPVIPIPGGFQPRAAIGYSLVAALEAAALGGAAPSLRDEIEAAADLAEALAVEWGPELRRGLGGQDDRARAARHRARDRGRRGRAPPRPTAGSASSTRTRSSRRSPSALPEMNHNEVVGWESARELGRFSYVSLEDPDAHERNRLRAELTAEIAEAGASPVVRVAARGASRVERLVSLVLLGDLVSIYAAVLRGADPVDIPAIDSLKASLSAHR